MPRLNHKYYYTDNNPTLFTDIKDCIKANNLTMDNYNKYIKGIGAKDIITAKEKLNRLIAEQNNC